MRKGVCFLLSSLMLTLLLNSSLFTAKTEAVSSGIGVSIYQHPNLSAVYDNNYLNNLRKAKEAGFSFNYQTIYWSQVQPDPNSPFNWSRYDRIFRQHAAVGITPVIFLWYPPYWAADAPEELKERHDKTVGLYPPAEFMREDSPWLKFVRAAVSRYKGYTKYWFIYHEPDHSFWFQTKPGVDKKEVFSRLFLATAQEIRKIDPSARIGVSLSSGSYSFIREIISEVDVVRFANYRQDSSFFPRLSSFPRPPVKEVWLEMGVRSDLLGEEGQAKALIDRLNYTWRLGRFDKIIIFRLLDENLIYTPFSTQRKWVSLGLIKANGVPKLSFWSIKECLKDQSLCQQRPEDILRMARQDLIKPSPVSSSSFFCQSINIKWRGKKLFPQNNRLILPSLRFDIVYKLVNQKNPIRDTGVWFSRGLGEEDWVRIGGQRSVLQKQAEVSLSIFPNQDPDPLDATPLSSINQIFSPGVGEIKVTASEFNGRSLLNDGCRTQVQICPLAERGDVNCDGKVDKNDFELIKNNWHRRQGSFAEGDINQDGKVGMIDLEILKAHFKEDIRDVYPFLESGNNE